MAPDAEADDEPKEAETIPETGPHSPNVSVSAGDGEPMRHDCYITDHDRDRLESLGEYIARRDDAHVYVCDYDRGELKVRLNLEDTWSQRARRDWYDNRIDQRIERVVNRLAVMNWNHFEPDEMRDVLRAMELLEGAAERMVIGQRLAWERSSGEERGEQ